MKKFLSILLALAVGFTFTFGSAMSAFAAKDSTYTYAQAYALLDDTAKELKANAETDMNTALKSYSPVAVEEVNISKEAAKELFTEIYEEYCKKVDNAVKAQKDALDALYAAGTTTFKDGTTVYNGVTFSTADLGTGKITAPTYTVANSSEADKIKALKAEFKVVKADQLADLAAIDTSVYSTTKASGASETPAETATRLVAQATAQVNGFTVSATDDAAAVAEKIKKIGQIYAKGEGTAAATGALAEGGKVDLYDYEDGINKLSKAADEVKDSAKLEYAKTRALASLTDEINAAMKDKVNVYEAEILAEKVKTNPNAKTIATAEANIEEAKADYAGILEVVTYYVNNQKTFGKLAAFDGDSFKTVVPHYSDENGLYTGVSTTVTISGGYYTSYTKANMIVMAELAAKATKAAEEAKSVINIAGDTYVGIDDALKDAIKDIYINGKDTYPSFATTAEASLYNYVKNKLIGEDDGTVTINKVKYPSIADWDVSAYDKAKQEEVQGIIDAAKEAVRAAATTEAANAAFLEAYTKLQAVPTKVDHQRDFLSGKYKTKYDSVKAELTAYANYKNDAYNATGLYQKDAAKTLATTYTESNGLFYTECFTDTELDAMLVEAKAAIDNLKTTASLKEDAAAIDAEIAALPKVGAITLANKEAVFAVFDKVNAHNEACKSVGDTTNTVRTGTIGMLVGAIKDLELAAINDAIAAIDRDGAVTVDEEEAVAALRANIDAYNKLAATDYYKIYYASAIGEDNADDISDIEDALLTAQVKDVVSKINSLPATGATAEQVKAVTDAYNALGRDGKHILDTQYVAAYSKLIDAQKLVKWTTEDVKAYVFDQTVKASSVKLSAKKVKVTANFDDSKLTENGYTVEYKFYKSTKKSSGYTYTGITKSGDNATYTNTNAKKGANYYKFKVVVKDADGTVILTTALKDCKYACRTIK